MHSADDEPSAVPIEGTSAAAAPSTTVPKTGAARQTPAAAGGPGLFDRARAQGVAGAATATVLEEDAAMEALLGCYLRSTHVVVASQRDTHRNIIDKLIAALKAATISTNPHQKIVFATKMACVAEKVGELKEDKFWLLIYVNLHKKSIILVDPRGLQQAEDLVVRMDKFTFNPEEIEIAGLQKDRQDVIQSVLQLRSAMDAVYGETLRHLPCTITHAIQSKEPRFSLPLAVNNACILHEGRNPPAHKDYGGPITRERIIKMMEEQSDLLTQLQVLKMRSDAAHVPKQS